MATIKVGRKRYKLPKNCKAENLVSSLKVAEGAKCFCGRPAIYVRHHEGREYCSDCFLRQIERKFKRNVRKHALVSKGDRIAVALSGSKDSSTLLYLMKELSRQMPFELVAVTADEGIKKYRAAGIKCAKVLCKRIGVPHYTVSFKDMFGLDLDAIPQKLVKESPWCTWCGVLRRRALNTAARKLGCTKLAVGHTLDDEAQSVLLGMIRGDINQFLRLGFASGSESDGRFVQRIKPLRNIPEAETALYALLKGLNFSHAACPHSSEVMRKHVRAYLNDMEGHYPGTKMRILQFYDKLASEIAMRKKSPIGACESCGEPSSGKECKVCSLLKQLNKL